MEHIDKKKIINFPSYIKENYKKIVCVFFTVAKYLFSALLITLSFFNIHSKKYLLVCFLELFLVFLVTESIKFRIIRQIINALLLLLLNAQFLVLLLGSSYIKLVMLTNVDSLEDLSGNFLVYLLFVILVILFSFLPSSRLIPQKEWVYSCIIFCLCAELLFTLNFGNEFSPLYSYITLIKSKNERDKEIREALSSKDEKTHLFYNESMGDYIEKPNELSENPNIVLILTEGLSQNIIDDNREIMPNVKRFQSQSISFEGYYNHSFATYRGIIGQLYSGYQMDNYDSNTLISIEEVLKDKGYYTCFINTEPNNKEFTDYLNELKFDDVINKKMDYEGNVNTLSDKQAYSVLTETIKQCDKNDKPYFVVIYTFGTHASLDSPDEKYGDSKDPMLNKFYNLDYQFGGFYDSFIQDGISDDTLLVFTADHCTYGDQDFTSSFPDHGRVITLIDSMPLSIWYKGVEPQTISVNGRNSLDLAPTILDIVDISDDNYFLGESLFSDNGTEYSTVFECEGLYYQTDGCEIEQLDEDDKSIFVDKIYDYFIAKKQKPIGKY